METQEVKQLLQRYFEGESSVSDEQKLKDYFQCGEVAEELEEYAGFFGGIRELSKAADDDSIENEVMDYILENEAEEKSKYRTLWKTVTGIAASIIIVVGGLLLYQQQDKTYEDTFENPEVAYAVAEDALEYMSAKYNKGLAELSNFDKLQTASQPLRNGVEPVNEFYENIENMDSEESESK
ncbi:MAG: hypothetical protein ACQETJ_06480 [Bacteroidota bacterium]